MIRSLLLCLVLLALAPPARAANTTEGPSFVHLKPISFSVIGPGNKITKEVSIILNLELEDGRDEKELEPYKRQMADAFLVTLSDAFDSVPAGGDVDLVTMKERLLKVATGIAGPHFIRSVLVIGIGERVHPH